MLIASNVIFASFLVLNRENTVSLYDVFFEEIPASRRLARSSSGCLLYLATTVITPLASSLRSWEIYQRKLSGIILKLGKIKNQCIRE